MNSILQRPAVLHVALNPLTGPWSVMRDLAMAQAASGRYGAVGIGVIAPKDWPAQYAEELRQTGLPAYRSSTLKTFGTAQFIWQRFQRPPIGDWADDLRSNSGAERVVVHFHNAWMSGVFLPLRKSISGEIRTVATFHGVNAQLDSRRFRHALHRWMAARLPRHDARLTSVDRSNLPLAEKSSACVRICSRSFPMAWWTIPNPRVRFGVGKGNSTSDISAASPNARAGGWRRMPFYSFELKDSRFG